MFSQAFIHTILTIIPFLFYVMVSIKKNRKYELGKVSIVSCVALLLIMGILMGLTPVEEGADKYNYMMEFLGVSENRTSEPGWMLYVGICRLLFGSNFILYFVFTALFYSFLYLFVAYKLFPKDVVGYFIIMTVGAMGFVGYGDNAIRSGMSIAVFLFAISFPNKAKVSLLLILLSLLIHRATVLPVSAYFATFFIKNKKLWELFWVICLLLSILNMDLSPLYQKFGFVDDKVDRYVDTIGGVNDYDSRFRFDFLIYSVVPLYISNIWMNKYKYYNAFYSHMYNTYLLSNAMWLLVIRMAFTDRMAYLSWFLIPILVLYPVLTYEVRMKNAQRVVVFLMGIFIGLNVFLSILR